MLSFLIFKGQRKNTLFLSDSVLLYPLCSIILIIFYYIQEIQKQSTNTLLERSVCDSFIKMWKAYLQRTGTIQLVYIKQCVFFRKEVIYVLFLRTDVIIFRARLKRCRRVWRNFTLALYQYSAWVKLNFLLLYLIFN